ncbi:hypothetical protein [Knoellia sinensis]|nr:hypothetical protein [Knoellia sinensis]
MTGIQEETRSRRRFGLTTVAGFAALAVALFVLMPDERGGTAKTSPRPSSSGSGSTATTEPRPLASLSLDEVRSQGQPYSDLVSADPGRTASVQLVAACPEDQNPFEEFGKNCRAIWVIANDGDELLTEAAGPHANPILLGEGLFLHAYVRESITGAAGPIDAFLVDGGSMTLTTLTVAETAGGPGPGRRLAPCVVPYGAAACVVDLPKKRLEYLDPAALPRWLSEYVSGDWLANGWPTPDGQLDARFGPVIPLDNDAYYIPEWIGPTGDSSGPLLVSASMRAPAPVALGDSIRPTRGVRWVPCVPEEQRLCRLELKTRTLHPIDLPFGPGVQWAHNTRAGFWGLLIEDGDSAGQKSTAVWVDRNGAEHRHQLDSSSGHVTLADGGTSDAMTYYAITPSGNRLHASLDLGRSWRVFTVPDTVTQADIDVGRLPSSWRTWPKAG